MGIDIAFLHYRWLSYWVSSGQMAEDSPVDAINLDHTRYYFWSVKPVP